MPVSPQTRRVLQYRLGNFAAVNEICAHQSRPVKFIAA
jgi:hypothetical protein